MVKKEFKREFKKGNYRICAYGKSSVSVWNNNKEIFHTGFYRKNIKTMDLEKELNEILNLLKMLRSSKSQTIAAGRKKKQTTNEILDDIIKQIENNFESIIGVYDRNTPTNQTPTYKIERNNARKQCIEIIRRAKQC